MPSQLHERLVEMFRDQSRSVADLLAQFDMPLPEYDEVCTESADLVDLKPAEYHADLVLFFELESQKKLGVIVEVQFGCDDGKEYSWPAYIANLRRRHRCPVCLLVITIDKAIERWAGKTIQLGPGTYCTPCVVGPSNTPLIADSQRASENVELAVLSAIEHLRHPDRDLAARIVTTAVKASNGIDAERRRMYFDLLSLFIREQSPEILENIMKTSPVFKSRYLSDFARNYEAQGWVKGRREIVLKQLQQRFGPLSDGFLTRVSEAEDYQVEDIALLMFKAKSPEELLPCLD
jgi:hypothetical protein